MFASTRLAEQVQARTTARHAVVQGLGMRRFVHGRFSGMMVEVSDIAGVCSHRRAGWSVYMSLQHFYYTPKLFTDNRQTSIVSDVHSWRAYTATATM
jgi:hypothetical protein